MKDDRYIGVHQFTILVIFFGVGTSLLIGPEAVAEVAMQDAWISTLIGLVLASIPIAVYAALAKRYPHKSLVEILQLVWGKWPGKAVSFLYLIYFLILTVLLLGTAGYFLTTEVLPETPMIAILVCLMTVVIMGARLGPEVIARGGEVFFPWVILLFVLLILMLFPEINIEKMQPILENGWGPVWKATIPFASLQEYVVLTMIYPYLKNSPKNTPAFFTGHLIAGMVLVIFMLLCIVVLGPGSTAANVYPSFTLAKKINIGEFIERVEVIIGGVWFFTLTFKLILTFYAVVIGTAQVFGFKSYSFLTIPLGMLAIALMIPISPNIVYDMDFTRRVWPAYSYTFIMVFPLLTWLVSLFRKPKEKKAAT